MLIMVKTYELTGPQAITFQEAVADNLLMQQIERSTFDPFQFGNVSNINLEQAGVPAELRMVNQLLV